MTLDVQAFGLAGGIVYAVLIFLMTMAGFLLGYGLEYLAILAQLFPLYSVSLVGSLIGIVYGFIMGFVVFYGLGYVYNQLVK